MGRRKTPSANGTISWDGPLSTPLPDPALVFLVNGHRDLEAYDASRRAVVANVAGLLSRAGQDLAQFRSILDFGCGCGRILSGMEPFLSDDTLLQGCDINSALVDFCSSNIKYARVFRQNYFPPTPLADASVDLFLAGSVFTHLSLPALVQWSGEFTRLATRDAVAIISTHGSYYHGELALIDRNLVQSLAQHGVCTFIHGSPDQTWAGSNHHATWMTPEFLRRLMIGWEEIYAEPGISHGPQPFASYQDIAIFRRLDI
jgi:SAM-dependent methyltransferase